MKLIALEKNGFPLIRSIPASLLETLNSISGFCFSRQKRRLPGLPKYLRIKSPKPPSKV